MRRSSLGHVKSHGDPGVAARDKRLQSMYGSTEPVACLQPVCRIALTIQIKGVTLLARCSVRCLKAWPPAGTQERLPKGQKRQEIHNAVFHLGHLILFISPHLHLENAILLHLEHLDLRWFHLSILHLHPGRGISSNFILSKKIG